MTFKFDCESIETLRLEQYPIKGLYSFWTDRKVRYFLHFELLDFDVQI